MPDLSILHGVAGAVAVVLAPLAALGLAFFLAAVIHGAGHALAGWSVGWAPRRVMLGLRGKYRGSFSLGRTHVVLRGWMTGGWTEFERAEGFTGAKGFWVLLGGPLSGLLAAAAAGLGIALCLQGKEDGGYGLFPAGPDTATFWLAFFLIANLCCALRHLLPCFQALPDRPELLSDGWQLTGVLARWRNLPPERTARLRRRWAVLMALGITAMTVGLLVWEHESRHQQWRRHLRELRFMDIPLSRRPAPTLPVAIFVIPPIFLMTLAWKTAKSPLPVENAAFSSGDPLYDEARQAWLRWDFAPALRLVGERRDSPVGEVFWQALELELRHVTGDFAASERLSGILLSAAREGGEEAESGQDWILERRVIALAELGREAEADDAMDTLRVNQNSEQWQLSLDTIATAALQRENQALCGLCLPHLRRACREFPDLLTLQGTLGAVLAELEMKEESVPVLRKVLQKTQCLSDLGIVSVFLAKIAAAEGRLREARRHVSRAVRICDVVWVHQRAARIPGGPVCPPGREHARVTLC